ncbi:GNAT family N-acetyltransferase [Candidatus Woesearchaeota archaeon]|nr:GNAT family N-acetyltransferase [Candidatus Woesearchaeota archaeon]
MIIRKANTKDISQLKKMKKDLFITWDKIDPMDKLDKKWFLSKDSDDYMKKLIDRKDAIYLVAEEKGVIIGFIYGFIEKRDPCLLDKKTGFIDELYIEPEYRKKGLAKKLTNAVLKWFKSKNLRWSVVCTHAMDKPANSYWKNTGFEDFNIKYKIKL